MNTQCLKNLSHQVKSIKGIIIQPHINYFTRNWETKLFARNYHSVQDHIFPVPNFKWKRFKSSSTEIHSSFCQTVLFVKVWKNLISHVLFGCFLQWISNLSQASYSHKQTYTKLHEITKSKHKITLSSVFRFLFQLVGQSVRHTVYQRFTISHSTS